MKRLFLWGILCLIPVLALADDNSNPPAPPPVPDDSSMMPPPVGDLNQAPSLPPPPSDALKALDQNQPTPTPSSKDSGTSTSNQTEPPPPPPVSDENAAPPMPEEPTPTFTPVIKKKKKEAPKPTPTVEMPAEPPAPPSEENGAMEEKPASAGQNERSALPGGGTLTDYFPTSEGQQWSYEYLKPGGGEGTRRVECTGQKTLPNGAIHVVLEITQGEKKFRERYSLYDNKVEHTMTADKLFTGNFAFKLPPPGGSTHWTRAGKGGTSESYKAVFSKARVSQKTYPDCVVVTEKVMKGGKLQSTIISYYAKGTGLVAVEVYSKDKQLIGNKSFTLVSNP